MTVLIRYHAKPGMAETARDALIAILNTVVAKEPECGGIRLLEDPDDPHRLLLIEQWPDAATFMGPHSQTPHLRAFIRDADAFLAGPPEIRFWREIAAASPSHP